MTLNFGISLADKGAISVKLLIAVVIGIIVLAVVVYLMFFYTGESSLDCHLCSSMFAEWCQKCLTELYNWNRTLNGLPWVNNIDKSDELKECLDTCTNIDLDPGPDGTCNELQDECEKYIYMPPVIYTTTT